MSVPNHSHVPKQLYATGLYDLKTHDGHHAFVDATVATLNGLDPNWRHLKKSAGQTQLHRHAEDAALYLLPNNEARAVDFIAGAGGANPQPGWIVDAFPYKHSDAHDPDDHGLERAAPPPPPILRVPSYAELGGDALFRDMVGVPLAADMAAAGQSLNEGSAVWFARTVYSLMTARLRENGKPIDPVPIVKKHRNEWRHILGLPQLT